MFFDKIEVIFMSKDKYNDFNIYNITMEYTVNKIVDLKKYIISPIHNNCQILRTDKFE